MVNATIVHFTGEPLRGALSCRVEGRPQATAACWALEAIQERDQGRRSAEPRHGRAIRDTEDADGWTGQLGAVIIRLCDTAANAAGLGECAGGLAGLPT